MARCAYELNLLISQRPNSVLEQVTTHNSSQNELEYLEIFDFFNYPRLNAIAGNAFDPSVTIAPTTNNQQTPTPTQGQPPSFRATPAFVIPNPESDWLIFKPPYE